MYITFFLNFDKKFANYLNNAATTPEAQFLNQTVYKWGVLIKDVIGLGLPQKMNLYYAQESKKLKNNFYYYITTTIKANFSMQKNKP